MTVDRRPSSCCRCERDERHGPDLGQEGVSAVAEHPLEPLTADEFQQTAAILRRDGHVTDTFRFASIELREPDKDDVLAWRAGDPVPRTSFAVVWNRTDNRTYEATVDLMRFDPAAPKSEVAADPATPVWTWATQKNIGFIQRRMCQETAVHRWDAEHAGGRDHSIEPGLAVDGIDEFLDYFIADVN